MIRNRNFSFVLLNLYSWPKVFVCNPHRLNTILQQESVGAVEFLAVILVGLQVVSAVVYRGAEHSAKWVVVRYLLHNAKFVYNGAVVAIVKPVFHNFELLFFTAVNVQNYF